jgi:hypothetical protein
LQVGSRADPSVAWNGAQRLISKNLLEYLDLSSSKNKDPKLNYVILTIDVGEVQSKALQLQLGKVKFSTVIL